MKACPSCGGEVKTHNRYSPHCSRACQGSVEPNGPASVNLTYGEALHQATLMVCAAHGEDPHVDRTLVQGRLLSRYDQRKIEAKSILAVLKVVLPERFDG